MFVVGTAGHVDHGKSSLVLALTGTDPDRWIEERLRGMTLDLGFAQLRFADGMRAGIVDVPGHERYLHNMLAGACGMDAVLVVVAANEGVRAQTREHLAILAFLNVRRAVIVLTKSDLVDDATLAAVTVAVREALASTIARDAPMVAVSARTGAGLDVLRATLRDALASLTRRAHDTPVFLPIDRVFSLTGRGTVVTGTLAAGTLRVGDTLRLTPPERDVRVRSLQVFGVAQNAVPAGTRVAVNLPGVDAGELERGAVLADAAFLPRTSLAVRVRTVDGARAPLRKRMPVRVTLGSAEALGKLVFAALPEGSETVSATLVLRAASVTYPNQPFVLRTMSPPMLLGGGTVVGAATANERGMDPTCAVEAGDAHDVAEAADVADDFEASDEAGRHDAAARAEFARVLAAAGERGATPLQLAAGANLRVERVEALAAAAIARGDAVLLGKPTAYVDGAVADALRARIIGAFERRQQEAPWLLGATTLGLARELAIDETLLLRILTAEVNAGHIAARDGYYFTVGHHARLGSEQRAFFERAFPVDAHSPLAPVALRALLDAVRAERIAGLAQAFDTLLTTGALVKVGADVYRGTQMADIRARLDAAVRRDGPITPARFRDAIGTSRKYAVPLLEWFDANGATVRDGDLRRLRDR